MVISVSFVAYLALSLGGMTWAAEALTAQIWADDVPDKSTSKHWRCRVLIKCEKGTS